MNREAQDDLVREQLLIADLIVQVLDARKLMTLGEREHLRDWLIERGIKTIVFVVNFLKLLEPDEQKEVFHHLRFVAESFRSGLPSKISNLYRVDALPALRARLKGDMSAAQTSGLAAFESALQNIVSVQQQMADRLPRVVAIASQVKTALQAKAQALNTEIIAAQQNHQTKIEIKQKAEGLVGAAVVSGVSCLINQNAQEKPDSLTSCQQQVIQAYADAAKDYLTHFSNEACLALQQYEEKAKEVIGFQAEQELLAVTSQHHQLQLINSLLDNLKQELDFLKSCSNLV